MSIQIFAADDSASMRRILEMSFAGEAAEVRGFSDGPTLIAAAQEAAPAAILLDLSLPGMDGYEVAAALRAEPETSQTPIIFLTNREVSVDPLRAETLTISGHIEKPFEAHRLVALVGEAVTHTTAGPPADMTGRVTAPMADEAEAASAVGKASGTRTRPGLGSATLDGLGEPPPFPKNPPPLPDGLVGAVEMIASILPPGQAGAISDEIYTRMGEFGLSSEQLTAVVAVAHEVVERVVWEVVPELAERIIREEIKRLTSD